MGSFSINTNVTSLQAQQNLAASAAFQAKTINEVTSGLRIVNSGDDAAGLAVANSLRSDQATLTQGIQNANNGLSTLQTIDGGINNISTLLDRASTLAAQSASGTFTGSRATLNSEYQSVLGEVNRQAQAIGLNTGGTFAAQLSVFIGGGTAGNGTTAVQNGTIGIDLSKSAVDGQALGLNGTQASGVAGTDISDGGATTVTNILAANGTTVGTPDASTSFSISGAGFSDAGTQKLTVNLAGVTDTASLASAINSAIKLATTTSTGASTGSAFANAGITASISTDSSGKQQLTFSSGTAAFQVQAGDQTANALLGNFNVTAANTSTGQALTSTATGGTLAGSTTAAALRVQGTGLSGPVDFALAATNTAALDLTDLKGTTVGESAANLASAAALTAANISVATVNNKLVFSSASGGSINVSTAGDTSNSLGFGSYVTGPAAAGATAFDATSAAGATLAGAALLANNGQTFQISLAGGSAISLATGALGATTAPLQGAAIAAALNTAIGKNAALTAAGLTASSSGAGDVTLTSANGTAFRLNATAFDGVTGTGVATDLGFGIAGTATAASTSNTLVTNSTIDSAGASSTAAFAFNPTAAQTITFSANDSSGTGHTTSIDLVNQTGAGTTQNAQSIDQAISSINAQLQASGDATLQSIVAVKADVVGGTAAAPTDTQGIKFISSLSTFDVTLGAVSTATSQQGIGSVTDQATTVVSSTGSQSDISTAAGAASAVTTLGNAVTELGAAQANVGKGENLLNYAVALAQTQVTNEAAAESRIRDADLAQEAANLSKAQILVQAGTAALAQANSAPQAILSLLK